MKSSDPANTDELFGPLRAKRASDEIAQRIRALILAGKLKPMDRLPSERALAEQFQVGRLTIREAFRILEERGLMQIRKGGAGGAFVAAPDAGREDATSIVMDNLELDGITGNQIPDARRVLGHGIAELAIKHATAEDLAEIEQYLSTYKTVSKPEAIRELVSKLINFQNLLAEASHNLLLMTFTRILVEWSRRNLTHWYPSQEEQQLIFNYHRELYESIKAKDVARAQSVTQCLVEAVLQRLRRLKVH